ncbi:hypothetical protein [Streptomyces lasiicapitis]|uniref:hypothetical protein n=1 Tax=Streptomyces lasiicapitis TaxID=1923961 RepID=UPI00369E4628
MGYAHYEIYRNGQKIEAGYAVAATCEEDGCGNRIDRGLSYLCGKMPGGDEHGCGGYYCENHLSCANQCKRCSDAADKVNTWVHPETGEEFDLRDQFLPAGQSYDARGIVWRHAGQRYGGIPVLEPIYAHGQVAAHGDTRLITDGEWENAAAVRHRQWREDTPLDGMVQS